jgi:hypothetical protein
MSAADLWWRIFELTGSVTAYLMYRRFRILQPDPVRP